MLFECLFALSVRPAADLLGSVLGLNGGGAAHLESVLLRSKRQESLGSVDVSRETSMLGVVRRFESVDLHRHGSTGLAACDPSA